MVGGKDGHDGVGISLADHGGAHADGRQRVPTFRFTDELFAGNGNKGIQNDVPVPLSRAHVELRTWDQTLCAHDCELQEALSGDGDQLFGQRCPAHRP